MDGTQELVVVARRVTNQYSSLSLDNHLCNPRPLPLDGSGLSFTYNYIQLLVSSSYGVLFQY